MLAIIATKEHPVYVKNRGYVKLMDVQKGDIVYAKKDRNARKRSLCRWLRGNHSNWGQKGKTRQVQENWRSLLLGLCEKKVFGKNAEKQSNDQPRVSTKIQGCFNGAMSNDSGWKRERVYKTPAEIIQSTWAWLVERINCYNWKGQDRKEITDKLQVGFGERVLQSSDRVRRGQTSGDRGPGKRQEEECLLGEYRVDSVEVYEYKDTERLQLSDNGDYVYNLEVEVNNNYFANNILVHNCEEAHVITKRSWDILIPTIRKDDSEIWVTFNPSLETDETYTRFVLNPPPDTLGIKLNYNDNPWFPEVLEKERLYCQESNPDDYPNIWEGDCKPAVEGAIYFKELQQIEKDKRILNIPYDPFLKVHIVPDLGAGDSLFVAMVQKSLSEIRIINTIVGTHFDYNTLSAELRELRYNWGKIWLPHDGYSKRIEAGGRSSYQILTKLGWDVAKREEIIELSIEEGIRNARMVFPRVYFDKEKTVDLIESLKRYRRRINRETHTATTPMHDDASHGADCFRYICANEGNFLNADDKPKFEYHAGYSPLDATIGY